MASARKRTVTAETKKTKNKVQTSKVNSVTSARLLWLAVVILILAVICGVYFAYKEKLLLKPSTSAQPKTSDPKTKSKTINKQQSKAKKTKTQSEITNKYDKQILKELHKAEKILEKGQIDEALVKFQNLVNRYPNSPRARYGLAQAFDRQSEKMQSNQILQRSIEAYAAVEQVPDCPLELKRLAMMRMANRLSFFGKSPAAVKVLERLHQFVPSDAKVLSELGVQYLLIGRNNAAKDVFRKVLKVNPNDGFAKSHLGFIIKTTDLNYEEAIPLLADGVHSGDQDAEHGRFYFHLGDALTRIGKPEEAYKVYGEAASKGIFLSAWQRSLYNADTPLKAQPWWTAEESGYAKAIRKLEANWQTIRDEGLAVINQKTGGFEPEEENLRHLGDWKQFTLYFQGRRSEAACKKTPRTCALVNTISDASGCTRGQIKYSIMFPGTHVWPHTGPTNCRLRAHLGLVIPEKVAIRVGNETRTWEEGKVVIIDDSFDHEVWHNGSSFRMILIVDFWHPDLTQHQRRTLSPI